MSHLIGKTVVNVKDYGALGNGSIDDLAAINMASNVAFTAGGGTVYFPAGTYVVSDTVLLRSNVTYKGDGPNASIISQTTANVPVAASKNYYSTYTLSPSAFMMVEGLRFLGGVAAGANNHGLVVRDYFSKVENCFFATTGGNGLHMVAVNDVGTAYSGTLVNNRVIGCTASGCAGIGFYLGAANNAKVTDGFMTDCAVSSIATSENHVYCGSSAGWRFSGIHCYGSGTPTGAAMDLENGYNTRISDCYIEGFGTHGIYLGAAQRNIAVSNCTIKLGPAAGAGIEMAKSGSVTSLEVSVTGCHFQNTGSNATIGIESNTATIMIRKSANSFLNTGAGSITSVVNPASKKAITTSTGTIQDTALTATVNYAGACAVTLPTSAYSSEAVLTVKDISGAASLVNVISFVLGSGTTLEYAHTISTPFGSIDWYLDGTVWRAK